MNVNIVVLALTLNLVRTYNLRRVEDILIVHIDRKVVFVMSTRRVIISLVVVMMVFSLTACAVTSAADPATPNNPSTPSDPAIPDNPGTGTGSSSNLSGSAMDVLANIDAALQETGIQMPMTLPPTKVTSEMSQNDVGLSSSDFDRLVDNAASSLAAIGTFAHQIVVIQAKDASAATEVKALVSGANGYDAQKWICVWPAKVIVVESGEYVLIAAANADVVDAAVAQFRAEAGTIGTVVTIFEHDGGIEAPAGGGAIALG